MLKAGQLPAPVIKPLRYDAVGTKIKVDTNTYIQIKSDYPGVKIFFTTDSTKPDPFQAGRTGKPSTHKYIGPFRLQLGSRVLKAIAVSRDRLRESAVTTKYIEVVPTAEAAAAGSSNSDQEFENASDMDDQDDELDFIRRNRKAIMPVAGGGGGDADEIGQYDVQSSLEGGPINPINYSGTQINVWGMPTPGLAGLFSPKPPPQANLGALTEEMIKNLNTPRVESNDCKSKKNIVYHNGMFYLGLSCPIKIIHRLNLKAAP